MAYKVAYCNLCNIMRSLGLVLLLFICGHAGYAAEMMNSSRAFKLGASSAESKIAPSNIGIIGIKYLHRQGEMSTVIAVYPNTPAEQAGIRVGDRIMKVDNTNITVFDADEVFSMISGRPGSPINLEVLRCQNNYGSHLGCSTFNVSMLRMDMNYIASDNVFRVYRYSN